jgi:hypothetical protein
MRGHGPIIFRSRAATCHGVDPLMLMDMGVTTSTSRCTPPGPPQDAFGVRTKFVMQED